MAVHGGAGAEPVCGRLYRHRSRAAWGDESSVAWGDYDNDGDLDILLTGFDDWNPVSKVYRNKGDGTFEDSGISNLTGVYYSSVAWEWGDENQVSLDNFRLQDWCHFCSIVSIGLVKVSVQSKVANVRYPAIVP
ncbi:MAG: VCBS repeat-containing protein, partial [Chloroflexi bacterium]|nr:VCBS repeat-containing protein [Chloroflexota bacterium]